MAQDITIAFMGNPNCGKTTLFNAYTGANLKVANWPGVTVERVEGAIRDHDMNLRLVDLPGTYSLTSYTMEEQVSRQFVMGDEVDMIINVVDASSLERSLYLTLQLLEIGKPVVVALNMMDIVHKRGMEIDLHRLPEMLGVPAIPVSGRSRTGLQTLMHTAAHHAQSVKPDKLIHNHGDHGLEDKHDQYAMVYSEPLEHKIDLLSERLDKRYPDIQNTRWVAIKLLEQDTEVIKKYPLDCADILDRSYETEIINEKYAFIEEMIHEVLFRHEEKEEMTDRVDRILTHRWFGLPIFLCIMAFVFFLTFFLGDRLSDGFQVLLTGLSNGTTHLLHLMHVSDVVVALVVDGVIAGVGGILTFLPNIFVLFLALALLEDSGYMARVAYVMDGIMGKLGLSGRAFLPMVLGFGCSVPAIMASRVLENPRDRYKTMLVTPFMSCSARLPIYVLFASIFFGKYKMIVAYSLYLIGIVAALLVLLVLHMGDKNHEPNDLLIELPEYKTPSARTVAIYVWEKVKDYLTKAGTTIFVASILMWLILNFGPGGYTTEMSQSYGALLGKWLVPFFAPIGLGFWQIAVALIAGISAKEVVVSSTAVLFGINNINSTQGMHALSGVLQGMGFGVLNAYCLMIFCLLYVPCIATLATIHKESRSWKWTGLTILFQMATAWVLTFVVYQVGLLL